MKFEFKGKIVEIVQGDITGIGTDVIVNAANEGLWGGGGVDGAIHRAGGPTIMAECRKIGRCPTGTAVITAGGNLPARFVIHTVGPVWGGAGGREVELLRSAYESSLTLADERKLRSIAFPSISTGVYGFPIEKACPVAVKAALDHLAGATSLEQVTFVLFSKGDYEVYLAELEKIFPQLSS